VLLYTRKHRLYLAITSDAQLHIYNENLLHVSCLPLHSNRTVTTAIFLENVGHLILGTVGGVNSQYLEVGCKYDPKSNLQLNPKGDRMVFKLHPDPEFQNSPDWVKGLKEQNNSKVGEELIVVWSMEKISVYTYK
jgi:hypothetical protein